MFTQIPSVFSDGCFLSVQPVNTRYRKIAVKTFQSFYREGTWIWQLPTEPARCPNVSLFFKGNLAIKYKVA